MYNKLFNKLNLNNITTQLNKNHHQTIINLIKNQIVQLHKTIKTPKQIKLKTHFETLNNLQLNISKKIINYKNPPLTNKFDITTHKNFPTITHIQTNLTLITLTYKITKITSIQYSHTINPHIFS